MRKNRFLFVIKFHLIDSSVNISTQLYVYDEIILFFIPFRLLLLPQKKREIDAKMFFTAQFLLFLSI